MFKIYEVGSKRYIKNIYPVCKFKNNKKVLAGGYIKYTRFESRALSISDKNIKRTIKLVMALEPKSVFWPEEHIDRKSTNLYVIGLLTGILALLFFCESVLFIKQSVPSESKTEISVNSESGFIKPFEEKIDLEPEKPIKLPVESTSKVNFVIEKSINYVSEFYAEELAKVVWSKHRKYNLPVDFIYAVILTESGDVNLGVLCSNSPKASSNANCRGFMQISEILVSEYNRVNNTTYTHDDVWDTEVNLEIGCWYLADNYKTLSRQGKTDKYYRCYVIYNLGYSYYKKYEDSLMKGWFYWDGKWQQYSPGERYRKARKKTWAYFEG